MSNNKNTHRPAARNDRRPAARNAASKGARREERREARHRRAMAALELCAPYAERAVDRALAFWASEAGERAAVRFEQMLERAVSSAPAQRALSALLAYAERGLAAEAEEGEARSKRGLAEERVALERVLAEGHRAEELAQLRHRAAVAELEREARGAEARLAEPAPEPEPEPAPEPEPLVSAGLSPALVEAIAINAALHEEVGRLEAKLRLLAQAEEDPLVRALGLSATAGSAEPDSATAEPDSATAEPDSATAEPDSATAEPDSATASSDARWQQQWREHELRVLAKLEELRRNC